MSSSLSELLQLSAARHSHLCPRQVLGVRAGLAGLAALGVQAPITKQTALVIAETDGCFIDGIEAATGATVGHRTLRVNDLGKVAATFAEVHTGRAVRISPQPLARAIAARYAPWESRRYFAQLAGYQRMPDSELFHFQMVDLSPGLEVLLSNPGARATCSVCGEEIINQREVIVHGAIICRSCAGFSYYEVVSESVQVCSVTSEAFN